MEPHETIGRSSEAVAPLGAAPRLVLYVDGRGRIRLASGSSFAGMPAAETLIGVDARALLAGFPALSLALERGLGGAVTIEVERWHDDSFSVRGLPAALDGAPGVLLICLDAAPVGAWMRLYEAQLRAFLTRTPASVWITDEELRIRHAIGQVLVPHAHHDPETLIGQRLQEILGTDDPANQAIAHHRAALDGRPTQFRHRSDGRTLEVYLEPWHGIGDRIRGCVGLSLDISESLARQERLEASERWLAEAQSVAHLGSWQWRVGDDRVDWSEEMHRIYGLPPGSFEGTYHAFLDRVHPEDRALTEHTVLQALRTGAPFQYDHRILRADGSVRTLWTLGKVKREGERPVALLGSCMDVTETRRATSDNLHALSLLRATLDSTQDGILVIGLDRRVTAWNQRFLELWSIASESINDGDDERLLESVLPLLEDPRGFMARVRELYERPDEESFDVIAFKDGRAFERYSRPQRMGGDLIGRVWSFRDVTERTRLYSRAVFLADASRLLASLDVEQAMKALAHLVVPFFGDACAVNLLVDEAGPRRLLGDLGDRAGALLEEIPRAAMTGHSLAYETAGRSCLAVPLQGRDTLLGVMSFVAAPGRKFDAKDLELAEELAHRVALALDNARLYRRAERMLETRDEFLSIAAHELRGPVTSLALAVQSLRTGKLPPSAGPKTLDLCARQVRQIARFIDELLDVGRIRAGRLHFDLTEVDLAMITREAAARMTPEVTRSGSTLTVSSAGNVVGFWDPMRLDQLVTNLLANASKFGQGKPITIEVRGTERVGILTVRDHGIGIPEERQADIFRPFERAVSPRRYGGLGLGLYICHTIVEGFGGSIRVESTPGSGSLFTVELPRSQRRS